MLQVVRGEMAKVKLSGAVLLLLLVVPLCMYTCALLFGVQLGRAMERGPDDRAAGVGFTWRGALNYVTKELWDMNVLGRRRGGRRLWISAGVRELEPVVVQGRRGGARSSSSSSSKQPYVVPFSDLPPANDVLETKSRANYTSSTQRRQYSNHTSPRGVISVGTWGGFGGSPFYMHGTTAPRLRSIVLYHSGAIHSLACEYTLAGDYQGRGRMTTRRVAGPWGLSHSFGSRGVRAQIDLASGEHITAVEGTTGHFANVPSVVITSLTFRTSAGRTYGPYGSVAAGSHHFSVPAADGACIAGFWGRSGWLVDAIGVYIKPSCSSSSDTAAVAYKKYASRRQGRN